MNIHGRWYCTNCDNIEDMEREVTCWKCGKGEMVFRRFKPELIPAPDQQTSTPEESK